MEQPAKTAWPLMTVSGFADVQLNVPEDGLDPIASVIDAVLVVTTSPFESSTETTGWVVKATPCVATEGGWVEKTSCVALPATVKLALVADVSEASVAFKVKAPWVPRLMVQPENVATPVTAAVAAQEVSVPVPVLMASVTVEVLVVMTSPDESSIETAGWTVKAEPPVLLVGWVVKASLFAVVPATVKLALVADVSVPSVAFKVKAPWVPRLIVQPEKVATPATAVLGLAVQEASVPLPVLMARVTAEVLVVMTSPDESSIETAGWTVKAEPPVLLVG
jgi:hypothetical protein